MINSKSLPLFPVWCEIPVMSGIVGVCCSIVCSVRCSLLRTKLSAFLHLCQTQTAGPEEICSVSAQLSQQHSGEDGWPVTADTSHADHRSLQAQAQDRGLPHFPLPPRYFFKFHIICIFPNLNKGIRVLRIMWNLFSFYTVFHLRVWDFSLALLLLSFLFLFLS